MPEYPERAVLECIVNALIHRDYMDMGSEVHIDIFDDRMEIYSPGGMYDGSFVQDLDMDRIPSKRRKARCDRAVKSGQSDAVGGEDE